MANSKTAVWSAKVEKHCTRQFIRHEFGEVETWKSFECADLNVLQYTG